MEEKTFSWVTHLLIFFGILLLFPQATLAATNGPSSDLQKGLFEEEANHNFSAAIQAYQSVITQLDEDRKLAATAIFRLGEVYRKQGKTNEALAQYQRVVRDFSDQSTLVTLSRQELAGLGSAAMAPLASLSNAARQEQKRLLEEEIKLAETNLAQQQKRVEAGTLGTDELWPKQREILELKRQLAALENGELEPNSVKEPITSSEAEEVKRIQALIKDSPDLINAQQQQSGVTLLQMAAGKGELAIVKLLLDNGAAVNGIKQPDWTPLHYAAGNGHKAVVDLLLSQGAIADARTESGVTPLHLAAFNGYTVVAKTLLEAGASVNARLSGDVSSGPGLRGYLPLHAGQTPLHAAAEAGYPSLVELLISKGADINAEDARGRTPLSYAAEARNEAMAKGLLAAHADPNAGRLNLPLNLAAHNGDVPLLELLLPKGANPNTNTLVDQAVTGQGGSFTPLFLAVNRGHSEAVKALIHFKADPNAMAAHGDSLLFYALPSKETLKALLEGGADPNARNEHDVSPLDQAIGANNPAAVQELLVHGADANSTNRRGWTPLHAATASGNKEIAELLLKQGANVNARSQDWIKTPLYAAIAYGHQALVELLLANKADPNTRGDVGDQNAGGTPLHLAVSKGQKEIIELLLARKADPNAPNNQGETPLDLASRPQPGSLPSFGTRLSSPPGSASSPSSPATPSSPASIADLLLQHGAVQDLPRPDRIEVRRPSANFSAVVFEKGAKDWNQFTLLELIAVHYELLTASPSGRTEQQHYPPTFAGLHFPDFAQVRLRRPAPDLKSWQERTIDLSAAFQSGDCSGDVPLEWGDVVEIPEADHPLNVNWQGLSKETTNALTKCLTRQVEVVVKGQATELSLAPRIPAVDHAFMQVMKVTYATFMVKPALDAAKLLLASSDLSRLKLKRNEPATGKAREWIVDCSQQGNPPDLWLRGGDVIDVPDKH